MADPEQRCPTCGTAVPEGATRCPGCGRVFGEENRCPHCHAIAAVIQRRDKTVCAACGKPRVGAVVLGGGRTEGILPSTRPGIEARTTEMVTRASGRAWRAFGVASLAGGVFLAALAAALLPGAIGLGVAVAGGLLGVGVGALAIRSGARKMAASEVHGGRADELAIFDLAKAEGGRLTAQRLADEHRLSLEAADVALTRLIGDGTRVGVDVDDEGVVSYVFYELVPPPPVRARVEVTGPEVGDADETAEAEAEAEREAPAKARRARKLDEG